MRGAADLFRGSLKLCGAATMKQDRMALGREVFRGKQPNAIRCTGDENCFCHGDPFQKVMCLVAHQSAALDAFAYRLDGGVLGHI